jgi:preprotein translocase subunit YajC
MQTQQIVILIGGFVALLALMIWPQWRSRRERQKRMAEMKPGIDIVTVGGIVGRLTYFDMDANRARLEIAPGVEITILPAAVNRALSPAGDEDENQIEADTSGGDDEAESDSAPSA